MATAESVRRPGPIENLRFGSQMISDRLALRVQHFRNEVRAGIEDAKTIITISRDENIPLEQRLAEMHRAREREREIGGIRGLVARGATFNAEPDLPAPFGEIP